MKSYNNLYEQIISLGNLTLAWRKARKGKTGRPDVIEFEIDIEKNLLDLHHELKSQTYKPRPLESFSIRDPKTRKISKSNFRDRIIHHAIINVIGPIFEKIFIHDSFASRKDKGNLAAIKRFDYFVRKVSRNYKLNGWFTNNQIKGYCLKADIEHYFEEVDHEILLAIISKRIKGKETIWLINQIVKANFSPAERERERAIRGRSRTHQAQISLKGMPLGNYTSQFFANIYLNELDYFVKHVLKAKYYIRYVDDFVILHNSKEQLTNWKKQISSFLKNKLKLELHPDKSGIINLSKGINFVGFRNLAHYKLVRKRCRRNMENKIERFKQYKTEFRSLLESYQGWQAHASWSNSYSLRNRIKKKIVKTIWHRTL